MEKARMIGYMAAAPHFQTRISLQAFWPFPWEIERAKSLADEWTNIDPERLRLFNEHAEKNRAARKAAR